MIPDKISPSSSEILILETGNIHEMASIANDTISNWQECNPDKDIVSSSLTSPTYINIHSFNYYVAFLTINWVRKA